MQPHGVSPWGFCFAGRRCYENAIKLSKKGSIYVRFDVKLQTYTEEFVMRCVTNSEAGMFLAFLSKT